MHVTRFICYLFILLAFKPSIGASPACDVEYSLPHNTWQMISLPCTPPTDNNTVSAVFGDDIHGVYKQDWILYSYDTSLNNYITLDEDSVLTPGVGYWIIQVDAGGNAATLDLPAESTPTPANGELTKSCLAGNLCSTAEMKGYSTETVQWNMLGNPTPNSVLMSTIRLADIEASPCNYGSPCSLQEAESHQLSHHSVWTFNGTEYVLKDPSSTIEPWAGFWSAALADLSDQQTLHWLFPYTTDELHDNSAARFLSQATFGASVESIAELQSLGSREAWIAQQLAASPTLTEAYVRRNSNGSLRPPRHHIWWHNAMTADDQLRQRVAFALSEIFVISDRDYELANSQYGVSNFYDMLIRNAFGNYRSLLEDVTLHPAMGIYLGMVLNQKANPELNTRPDENYAREVLQLFSLGLYQLNQDGTPIIGADNKACETFSPTHITAFARVFTGWNFAGNSDWSPNDYTSKDKVSPMQADANYHDTDAKTLLNLSTSIGSNGCRPLVNGTGVPAAQTPEADLSAALDNIFNHPNLAPFISKALIQRLTTSNPSGDYIHRVAAAFNDNGSGVRGDLAAVVSAILLDPEAIHGVLVNADFGKIKEPILLQTQLWNGVGARPSANPSSTDTINGYSTYWARSDRADEVLGQGPMRSPSVFNFFLPDHPLPNSSGLSAPELQIYTDGNVSTLNESLYYQVFRHNDLRSSSDSQVHFLLDQLSQLSNEQILQQLDTTLLAGQMSPRTYRDLLAYLNRMSDSTSNRELAITDTLFIISVSPTFRVQK